MSMSDSAKNNDTYTQQVKDPINPDHYKNKNGAQLIDVTRWLPFSMGNSIKYIFRNENKNSQLEDLKKSLWYFKDFLNNPVFVETDVDIHEITENVLDGTHDWESDRIRELLTIYFFMKNSKSPDKLKSIAQSFENSVHEKISEISQ